MTEIEKTLAERGARYGEFPVHARITQDLKSVMKAAPKWDDLTPAQMESLEMIAHKIGRMLNGDTTYLDNVVDIIGYATLMLQAMEDENGQETKKTSTPSYYVYPDGTFYSADETTADELILNGHSDDYQLVPLPLDQDGEPYIPDTFWDDPAT